MKFQFTPEMLQKGLMSIGLAAGQIKLIDDEVKAQLARLVMRAVASGNANEFLKERLGWIEERENAPEPEPPPKNVRVTSRVIRDEDKRR